VRTEGRLKRGVASRTNSDCPEDGSASENHRGHLVQLRLCLIQSIKKGGMQTGEQVIQETADRLSPPRASAATAPTQKTFYCRNLGSGGAMRGACTSLNTPRHTSKGLTACITFTYTKSDVHHAGCHTYKSYNIINAEDSTPDAHSPAMPHDPNFDYPFAPVRPPSL
jgi:hypothetical protein